MRADKFNSAQYARWSGPTQPSSLFNPFVLSDPVPRGYKWRILAVSLAGAPPSNQVFFLFAVAPSIVGKAANQNGGGIDWADFFSTNAGGVHDIYPVKQAVLISVGGPSATSGPQDNAVEPALNNGNGPIGISNSINGLIPYRGGFKPFTLPPGWALAGLQNPDGGGTAVARMILDAMFVQLPA